MLSKYEVWATSEGLEPSISCLCKNVGFFYCPEGAFCVGRLIKYPVRTSDRESVSPVRTCHKSANSWQESWNSWFFSRFWFESSKAQNMLAGRVDKNWRVNFVNVFDSKFNLLKIRDDYTKIRTLSLFDKWARTYTKSPFGATLALRV